MNDNTSPDSPKKGSARRICDYEGSGYREEFWENADRGYEDQTERLALKRLLPASGTRIVEIGAGFGRLADEYLGYQEVILLDYAHSMISDAHARLGSSQGKNADSPKFHFVCADLYRLPFAAHALDTIVQIRVLHHVEQVSAAFEEVARCLRGGGAYVLEFANKRNLKSILRYVARKQSENPFGQDPYEFIELNWNFHPDYVAEGLRASGLEPQAWRAVSHFRAQTLKQRLSSTSLARLDDRIGGALAGLALAPSQLVKSLHLKGGPVNQALWRCPRCAHEPLIAESGAVPCPKCGARWPIIDGVHVFREEAAIELGRPID
jgi:SAM-dependent methyltransferase